MIVSGHEKTFLFTFDKFRRYLTLLGRPRNWTANNFDIKINMDNKECSLGTRWNIDQLLDQKIFFLKAVTS